MGLVIFMLIFWPGFRRFCPQRDAVVTSHGRLTDYPPRKEPRMDGRR